VKPRTKKPLVVLGLREHIFTHSLSASAYFMSQQEYLFGTMWQRAWGGVAMGTGTLLPLRSHIRQANGYCRWSRTISLHTPQRAGIMASPLRVRMHYGWVQQASVAPPGLALLPRHLRTRSTGMPTVQSAPITPRRRHPDLFDKVWIATRGGTAKASSVVNVSEDIFAGEPPRHAVRFTR
jgi:hypothetical protein